MFKQQLFHNTTDKFQALTLIQILEALVGKYLSTLRSLTLFFITLLFSHFDNVRRLILCTIISISPILWTSEGKYVYFYKRYS